MDGLDTQLFKLFHCTSVEAREVADVIVWERGIAAVEELAGDRVCAVRSRGEIGSFGHGEHTEL